MQQIRDYTSQERATIDDNVQLIFARDEARPHCTALSVQSHDILETFTVYPRTARDIAVNERIWWTVHESSFCSATWPKSEKAGRQSVSVFALGIPSDLVQYLESVTLDEMHNSIICMLADAAKSEDEDGLQAMRADLYPAIWEHLTALLTRGVVPRPQRRSRPGGSRSREGSFSSTESDPARTSCRRPQSSTPDTSSRERETTRTKLRKGQESCMYASFLLDQALRNAQAHDYWQIGISGATFQAQGGPGGISFGSSQAFVMGSLYQDWQVYAKSCMVSERKSDRYRGQEDPCSTGMASSMQSQARATQRVRIQRGQVLQTMMRLVQERRQEDTWARARTVLQCASSTNNLLGRLPGQVVQHCILPKVVIEEDALDARRPMAVEIFQTLNQPPMDTST